HEARARESADQHNESVRRWQRLIPERLDRFAIRDAVRMHLAWTYRYTLPTEEQTKLENTQITVGDITGTPAEVSTRYAMPGFAARHPEALTRLPDDNAEVRKQLAQLRSELETFGTRSSSHYAAYLAEHGYSAQQIDAEMRGEETGPPVGQKKALKSFKKGGAHDPRHHRRHPRRHRRDDRHVHRRQERRRRHRRTHPQRRSRLLRLPGAGLRGPGDRDGGLGAMGLGFGPRPAGDLLGRLRVRRGAVRTHR